MKNLSLTFLLTMLIFAAFPLAASATINVDGSEGGSIYYGDAAGLEGAPYYPSSMARLNLNVYQNNIVYPGTGLRVGFFAPMQMYVSIIDFAPDGYAYLLLDNFYTAPGSNVLDWYVDGTVQGAQGREYLYLIASTELLSHEYLESVATDPKAYEPGDNIFATDIKSFDIGPTLGDSSAPGSYDPFVEIQGTPLEVYPTYYIFPRDTFYDNPYYYYYYYVPNHTLGGGKYYRTRIGVGGNNYYAYPKGGVILNNLSGLHTSGHLVNNRWQIIPGGYLGGTFTKLGIITSPLGLVIHPYYPPGFFESYKDWGDEFTFEIILNGEPQGYGYVVNDEQGEPVIYAPLSESALLDGDNEFEIRIPESATTLEIEGIEIVEADVPEEVDDETEDDKKPLHGHNW